MVWNRATRVRVDVASAGVTQGRKTGKSRKRLERQPNSKGVLCTKPSEGRISPFVAKPIAQLGGSTRKTQMPIPVAYCVANGYPRWPMVDHQAMYHYAQATLQQPLLPW